MSIHEVGDPTGQQLSMLCPADTPIPEYSERSQGSLPSIGKYSNGCRSGSGEGGLHA